MPMVYSLDEFLRLHPDPIWSETLGLRVCADGATVADDRLGSPRMFDPPDSEHDRLTLQVARQDVLVQRLAEDFVQHRQHAYSGGYGGMVPMLEEKRTLHDTAYAKLEELRREPAATPEAVELARKRRVHAEIAEHQLQEQAKARDAIARIKLCTDTGQTPLPLEEED